VTVNPGGPPEGIEQLRSAHEDGTTTEVEGGAPGASAVLSKVAHKGVERPDVQSGEGGRECESTSIAAELDGGGGATRTWGPGGAGVSEGVAELLPMATAVGTAGMELSSGVPGGEARKARGGCAELADWSLCTVLFAAG